MPAKTRRQQRAACADYGRMKKGKKPRTFTGATRQQVKDMCVMPVQRKKP